MLPPPAFSIAAPCLRRSQASVARSVVALIDDRKPNSASSAPNTHIVRLKVPAASSSAPRPSTFRIARVWPPLDSASRAARATSFGPCAMRSVSSAPRVPAFSPTRPTSFASRTSAPAFSARNAALIALTVSPGRSTEPFATACCSTGASTTSRAERPAHCVSPSPSRPTLRASLTMERPARTGADTADGDVGRGGHREAHRRQAQHQPVRPPRRSPDACPRARRP